LLVFEYCNTLFSGPGSIAGAHLRGTPMFIGIGTIVVIVIIVLVVMMLRRR
jgi:hypothetical protein